MPRPLYPQGNCPSRYQLDRSLGGPQKRSGRQGEETILAPTGIRTPTPQLSSPIRWVQTWFSNRKWIFWHWNALKSDNFCNDMMWRDNFKMCLRCKCVEREIGASGSAVCPRASFCYECLILEAEPGGRCRYRDGLRPGWPRFAFRQGQKIFLYSTTSRLAPGHTQAPIQLLERPRHEADHSPPSIVGIMNGGSILPLPIRFCGVVLYWLSTGTTLPFTFATRGAVYSIPWIFFVWWVLL
jgi:hypothetical protein